MIDHYTMTRLRCAATVAHTVPGVEVTLTHLGAAFVHVGASASTALPEGSETCLLSPCQFRSTVASAWGYQQLGRAIGCRGVPTGGSIEVGLRVANGDELQGMGVIRTTVAKRWVHLCALALDEAICRAVVGNRRDVGLHHDSTLGTTILHVESPLGDPRTPHDVALLHEMITGCTMAGFEHELAYELDRRPA